MKKTLILLACLLSNLFVQAAPISRSKAEAKARQFMSERGWTMSSKHSNIKAYDGTTGNTQDLLYAFNANDGKGFVIVSGDDVVDAILGYSTNGSFDAENVPAAMQDWLNSAQQQIAYASANKLKASSYAAEKPAIEPLVKSVWGQDAPYNAKCPIQNGEQTPTGCAATAMAQIMYYHQWPKEKTGKIPGYTTSTYNTYMPELPATQFDWAAMKDDYGPKEAGDAVADLMLYVGQAAYMDYAPAGSGAGSYYMLNSLTKYFGYSKTVKLVDRSGYSVDQWDDIIYNELVNKRPVFYAGFTPNWDGHAFVCDGYDGKGYYHINWGWDGLNNGYFRLTILNPHNTTSSGAASTDDGFTVNQSIIIGIQPEGGESINIPAKWPLTDWYLNGTDVKFSIYATAKGSYTFALAHENADGTLQILTEEQKQTLYTDYTKTLTFGLTGISAGTYHVVPVMRSSSDDKWWSLGDASHYMDLTVNADGTFDAILHPILDFVAQDVKVKRVNNETTRVDFNLTSKQDNYNGTLYMSIVTEKKTYTSEYPIYIYAGDKHPVTFYVANFDSGNFRLLVTTDRKGEKVLIDKQYQNYDLHIKDYTVTFDPLVAKITLQNNSDLPYENKLQTGFYRASNDKKLSSKSLNVSIPAGECIDIELTSTFKIKDDETYYFLISHIESELNPVFTDMTERVIVDPSQKNGILEISSAADAGTAFNINGQRVAEPQTGLVIVNGKKVIVK